MSDLVMLLREYATVIRQRPNLAFMSEDLDRAVARMEGLESRCAEKDASIAELIEQLEKAEAMSAALNRTIAGLDAALDEYRPTRTEG